MSHGPEHQIEHAEHAAHAAHDPFDRHVTVSIAMVAAVLAGVTMLGHRAHNETLVHQGEALRHQTLAAVKSNDATNKWGQFQALNIRGHMYGAFGEFAEELSADNPKLKVKARAWRDKSNVYETEKLPPIKKEAETFVAESRAEEKEAEQALHESHAMHGRTMFFDFGELGLQLGVVLCSLAILTKMRGFWYAGLGCSAVGLVLALVGLVSMLTSGAGGGEQH
jgi:hypothetical protein